MRPFDPRLLRYARSTWWLFVAQLIVGLAQTVAIVGVSWSLSHTIVAIFHDHATPHEIIGGLVSLSGWFALRVISLLLGDMYTARAARQIVHELRISALRRLDVRALVTGAVEAAQVTTVLGHGLRALDAYFRTFVPQLVLAVCATPLLFLVVLREDLTSAIVIAVTMPLIPIFMVLVGWYTQNVQTEQFHALRRLSAHFSDVVGGMQTLRIFRRAYHQRGVIEQVSDAYRTTTMKVLRVSFLSGFVLELASTLAVAVVAVGIGLRLVTGDLTLTVGLFVLLLAPEVFLPIRNVGGAYHAATEGIQAANEMFDLVDDVPVKDRTRRAKSTDTAAADPNTGITRAGLPTGHGLAVRDLEVSYTGVRALGPFTFVIPEGAIGVIRGSSGAGKTSLVNALMGFVSATGSVNGHDLGAGSSDALRQQIAWLDQRAPLVEGTVVDNLLLGSSMSAEAASPILTRACTLAAVSLPLTTRIDERNGGVSGGEQRRIAMARAYTRALERHTPLIVLDEPTSGIDAAAIQQIIAGWRQLVADGFTIIAVSHDEQVWQCADTIVDLDALNEHDRARGDGTRRDDERASAHVSAAD